MGWSIVQEYEQDPMSSNSDDAQKIRQAEQMAIRKRKVKTTASFTQSSSSTISKALSFQFRNVGFQNGYFLPIPTKVIDTCTGCGEQGHWRKNCFKVQQRNKTELIRT